MYRTELLSAGLYSIATFFVSFGVTTAVLTIFS